MPTKIRFSDTGYAIEDIMFQVMVVRDAVSAAYDTYCAEYVAYTAEDSDDQSEDYWRWLGHYGTAEKIVTDWWDALTLAEQQKFLSPRIERLEQEIEHLKNPVPREKVIYDLETKIRDLKIRYLMDP
jgi:hypothetical protein